MPRKYKMPRTFKNEETYQKFLDGAKKGANTQRILTQKSIDGFRQGGKNHLKNKIPIIAENKEQYKA